LRLGVARRSFFADLDPALEEVVDEALRQLQDSGVVLSKSTSRISRPSTPAWASRWLCSRRHDVPVYLEANHTGVTLQTGAAIASPDVKAVYEQSIIGPGAIPESVYRDAIEVFRRSSRRPTSAASATRARRAGVPDNPLPRADRQDQTVSSTAASLHAPHLHPATPTRIQRRHSR